MTVRTRPRARTRTTIGLTAALALTMGSLAGAPATAASSADGLTVDLFRTTGTFRGGANGTLYGLGDQGVPSPAVLDGAHVTNTSQKPPDGLQPPRGDALNVEKSFFAGSGKDLYVYVQD